MQGVFSGKHGLVQVKDAPPYTKEQEQSVYLDSLARAEFDQKRGTYVFEKKFANNAAALPEHLRQPRQHSLEPAASSLANAEAPDMASPPKVSAQTRLQVTLEENASG